VRPEPVVKGAKIENEPRDHDVHAIDLGRFNHAFALRSPQILDQRCYPARDFLTTRKEMHHDDGSRRGHCVE
jgi:hypothetical protein